MYGTALRFRDDTAADRTPPFRVLALDGGGIRGLFTASFLATLEDLGRGRIGQHFDLLVGTSMGGVLALALAFGAPAQTVFDLFLDTGRKVFSRPRRFGMLLRPKYDNRILAGALRDYFGSKTLNDALTPVCVTSYELQNSYPRIWKDDHAPDLAPAGDERHGRIHVERHLDPLAGQLAVRAPQRLLQRGAQRGRFLPAGRLADEAHEVARQLRRAHRFGHHAIDRLAIFGGDRAAPQQLRETDHRRQPVVERVDQIRQPGFERRRLPRPGADHARRDTAALPAPGHRRPTPTANTTVSTVSRRPVRATRSTPYARRAHQPGPSGSRAAIPASPP